MFDRRARNAEIFQDTKIMYKTNLKLRTAVQESINSQKLILEEEDVNLLGQLKEMAGKCQSQPKGRLRPRRVMRNKENRYAF